MNKKQIAAIKRLQAAIEACDKAGVHFANTHDTILTPYTKGDIVTYDDAIRFEQGRIFCWDEEIAIEDLTYLEYDSKPQLEAHAERFQQYKSLQINLLPAFFRTIADDGLVIVKNPNA